MSLSSLKRYLKKVCPKKHIPLSISNKEAKPFLARCYEDGSICIQSKLLKKSLAEQRGTLLHEIGHLLTWRRDWHRHISDNELSAQLMAIKLAKRNNLKKELKYLQDSAVAWASSSWNDTTFPARRYILMGKKYLALKNRTT